MPKITIANNHYNVDPLYQWDLNQKLYIYGVNIAVPILHFSNRDMGASINRYGDVDKKGVISVKIPNSILQNSNPVEVYICSYEGETFKTHYKILIPVKARTKPGDYTLEADDEEVYSFNALEHLIVQSLYEYDIKLNKSLNDYDEKYFNKYDEVNQRANDSLDKSKNCETIVTEYVRKFAELKNHVDTYDEKIVEAKNYVEPWNVEANVGKLCPNEVSESASGSYQSGQTVKRVNIIAINDGVVRIGFNCHSQIGSAKHFSNDTTYIKVLVNDTVIDTINFVAGDSTDKSYAGDLSVKKGDTITVELSAECLATSSGNSVHVFVEKCNLYANIETPYKYNYLTEDYNAVSTADILNTLLGV